MKKFYPERVYCEKDALDYTLGEKLYEHFSDEGVPVEFIASHNRLRQPEELSALEGFTWAKQTLVVGVKKTLRLQSCQPSADYRLVTGTSCPGRCHYCYLAATLGPAVYIRVYVNVDEILEAVDRYIERGLPGVTSFEASSSSDPVAVEHLTGTLRRLIAFFSRRDKGRLRVVTKFGAVDDLLDVEHGGRTRFRFSLNTRRLIDKHEGNTASFDERVEAARKVMEAGYPSGFIVAPLIAYGGWEGEYAQMLGELADRLGPEKRRQEITFELIMHRFTTRARRVIQTRYPDIELEMDPEKREHKGFGKYVYTPEVAGDLEQSLRTAIAENFPRARVEYFT